MIRLAAMPWPECMWVAEWDRGVCNLEFSYMLEPQTDILVLTSQVPSYKCTKGLISFSLWLQC